MKFPRFDPVQGAYVPFADLVRVRNALKRGRRVAIDEATIPMPPSSVDQTALFLLDHKKSSVLIS